MTDHLDKAREYAAQNDVFPAIAHALICIAEQGRNIAPQATSADLSAEQAPEAQTDTNTPAKPSEGEPGFGDWVDREGDLWRHDSAGWCFWDIDRWSNHRDWNGIGGAVAPRCYGPFRRAEPEDYDSTGAPHPEPHDANPVPPEPGVGAIVRLTDAEGNAWIAKHDGPGQWRVEDIWQPSWEHVVDAFGPEADILRDPDDPEGDAHRACKRAGMVAVKVPYGHDTPAPMREYGSRVDVDGKHLAADYIKAIAKGLDAQEALR